MGHGFSLDHLKRLKRDNTGNKSTMIRLCTDPREMRTWTGCGSGHKRKCTNSRMFFLLFKKNLFLIEVVRTSLQNGLDMFPPALHGPSYTVSGSTCVTNTIWQKYCCTIFEARCYVILLLSLCSFDDWVQVIDDCHHDIKTSHKLGDSIFAEKMRPSISSQHQEDHHVNESS